MLDKDKRYDIVVSRWPGMSLVTKNNNEQIKGKVVDMNKTEKLKAIYSLIKAGHIVQVSSPRLKCGGVVWLSENDNGDEFIGYSHFGTSATRPGIRNLRWILNTIFKSKSRNYRVTSDMYTTEPIND